MYKIIISIYFFILCITSLSISQAGCKPQNLTVDSCVVLTNLIQQKWSANPPNPTDSLITFNDNLDTRDMFHNYPAFMKCFNMMTRDDVKRLFGNPPNFSLFSGITTDTYTYCISVIRDRSNLICGYNFIDFTFKNGYVIDIEKSSMTMRE